MIFWEIFSGAAGLTSAFAANGWSVGHPIDILYCPEFDLLNPLFLGLCLGLIFERRIRLLHVGPPCSSFSMACNGCPSTMMRSMECPDGLPNLSPIRREKVTLGNALAQVAVKLCQAMSLAGCLWCWEQPWTSLMWVYGPVKAFMLKYCEGMAYVDVCFFGAPWKKPTGLAANFKGIEDLSRWCCCVRPHQILRGQGPGAKLGQLLHLHIGRRSQMSGRRLAASLDLVRMNCFRWLLISPGLVWPQRTCPLIKF